MGKVDHAERVDRNSPRWRLRFESLDFEWGVIFARRGDMLVPTGEQTGTWGVVVDDDRSTPLDDRARRALATEGFKSWEPVTGYSRQYGYAGCLMHPSEAFKGGVAGLVWEAAGEGDEFVLAYVDEVVRDETLEYEDSEQVGWVLLRRNTL